MRLSATMRFSGACIYHEVISAGTLDNVLDVVLDGVLSSGLDVVLDNVLDAPTSTRWHALQSGTLDTAPRLNRHEAVSQNRPDKRQD